MGAAPPPLNLCSGQQQSVQARPPRPRWVVAAPVCACAVAGAEGGAYIYIYIYGGGCVSAGKCMGVRGQVCACGCMLVHVRRVADLQHANAVHVPKLLCRHPLMAVALAFVSLYMFLPVLRASHDMSVCHTVHMCAPRGTGADGEAFPWGLTCTV